MITYVQCPHCFTRSSILYGASVICKCGERFTVQGNTTPRKIVQTVVPLDDDPQNFKELAEACILDMESYAADETPHRIMVSLRGYRERFALIERSLQNGC